VDNNGRTPLHQAAICGRATVIEALLTSNKINIEQRDKGGYTALHLASMWNWDKAIRALVAGGANMETTTPKGLYCLHLAAEWKKSRSVRALLELNADPDVMNQDGLTPLHIAKRKKCEELIEAFSSAMPEKEEVQHIEDPEEIRKKQQKMKRKLLQATTKGDSIESILEDPHVTEEMIETAVFAAVRAGRAETVEKLLDHTEIDLPSCVDENGQTLLHVAVIGRNTTIIEEFLAEDVPVNHQDNKQKTALHLAIAKRNTPLAIIRNIVTYNADLGIQDCDGNTVLHLLFLNQMPEKQVVERAEILLERMTPAQLNLQNASGATALLCACLQYDLAQEAANRVIAAGADVNIPNNDGHTPLYWAVKRNYVSVSKSLIYYGAVIEDQDTLFAGAQKRIVEVVLEAIDDMQAKERNTARVDNSEIFKWAEEGNIEQVEAWINNGGDVAAMDEFSSIPLHIACLNGHAEIVHLLLNAGSDVNFADENLQTPLHLAGMKGHAQVVQLLIDFEANPNVYDAEDQSPLDWATMLGHDAVIDILSPITS